MSKATVIPGAAQSGFAASSAYDAHRPSYPPEAVSQLLKALEIDGVKGARVMDLAAGTGKFTVLLSARPEQYEIVAIEPHHDMRSQLEQKKLDRVKIHDGSAESMPDVKDESVAAVVVAQAFHWFANVVALKEIHRVLQPTGVLGIIWNVEDYNAPRSWSITPGWETTVHNLTWSFHDNVHRFRHERWREVFDEQSKGNPLTLSFPDPLFSLPLGEGSVDFETWLSKEDVWKRYHTLSQISVLEGGELERVKKIFFDAINAKDTKTDDQGRVAVHGKTFFAWTTKIPEEPLRSGG